MYIRRTHTRTSEGGRRYFTFRLVQGERTANGVRQRTLLNLGSHFGIPREDWPDLCRRIVQLRDGRPSLLPSTSHGLEAEARRIVARLIARDAKPAGTQDGRDPETVHVDCTEAVRPRSVGVEHVGLRAMDRLGLRECLRELGIGPSLCVAAVGSIIARMANPGSECATRRWLRESSAVDELLGVDFPNLGKVRLCRASDALMAHRDAIERHIFSRAMDLFDLRPTVTLHDLTNTYLEGGATRQPKARRGRSKDRRADRPLLTLGLVLDAGGFVRRSQVFPGNQGEAATLSVMLDGLKAPPDALVVMDRGIATDDRLDWLRENGYRYLVVSRERTRCSVPDDAVCIGTASRRGIRLHRTVSADGREVRLHCFSEARAAKEREMVEQAAGRFESALTAISEGLSRPRTQKRPDRIWRRIGRIGAECRGIDRHYSVRMETDDTGNRATAIRFERRPVDGSAMTHPGVYCLRSSETDWDEETLWRRYSLLTDIEAVFRSLKSELGLRPIFHSSPIRAEGHLFISVIAFQLVQVIRRHLRRTGDGSGWSTLRSVLSGQRRITMTFHRADGRTIHLRRATRAEPPQIAVYDALGIDHEPGGIRRTMV